MSSQKFYYCSRAHFKGARAHFKGTRAAYYYFHHKAFLIIIYQIGATVNKVEFGWLIAVSDLPRPQAGHSRV
jgi:hypothetical protein